MALDYFDLQNMRRNHPAWRLMTADNGPFIATFLDTVFRDENRRDLPESDLVMRLEDFLFLIREQSDGQDFPRSAGGYLNDWADDNKGWLRRFYPPGSDEAHYDLTPATEKALNWMEGLFEESFIGTESRLYTVFNLLREIVHGVEEDREQRLANLERRKVEIESEMAAVREGNLERLDARSIRERFYQFSRTARELLGDFRTVDHNFRELDRRVREEITTWGGEKSDLLDRIFGEHDAITGSDQGMSFRAFWDFLMSPTSQEELSEMLDRIFCIEELGDALDDKRLRRIHYDWMSASEQTQRTVAKLSKQLRSFLDDRAFYESRRIIELLDSIEQRSLSLKDSMPQGDVAEIDGFKVEINLPFERPLFSPPVEAALDSTIENGDGEVIDSSLLFEQVFVDKTRLFESLNRELEHEGQISLATLIRRHPLVEGLSELITWLSVATEYPEVATDEGKKETVEWTDQYGKMRRATIPLTVFSRSAYSKEGRNL